MPSPSLLDPTRIVLDTNVVMDLFHFAAPLLARLMTAIQSGEILCLADERTLAELQRVTGYPQFRLDEAGRTMLLHRYQARLEIVPVPVTVPLPTITPLPRCKDPDDQIFLELAQRGQATMLISRDNLVLKLARARQRPCPFAIMSPDQAITHLFPKNQA